jgi:phage anti-repressor protein
MKALITITPQDINHKTFQTVSARELHKFMEVGRDFATWITGRIEKFGYEEGRDFIAITGSTNLGSGEFNPCPPKEYHLTIDMAKELAMVERNPMGRVARKYFIKCEQAAFELIPALQQELLAGNPLWSRISQYHALGLNQQEISKLIGRCKNTVRAHCRRMERCGLVALKPVGHRKQKKIENLHKEQEKQLSLFPSGRLQ